MREGREKGFERWKGEREMEEGERDWREGRENRTGKANQKSREKT